MRSNYSSERRYLTMSGKIGVGIIGLDHWYGALPTAETMAKSERVELVAIADRDAERLRGVAEKQRGSQVEGPR